MGYTTNFYGEITIDPPIPWGEIKDSPFAKKTSKYGEWEYDIKFRIEEEAVDTDEGRLLRRHAVAVVPAYEDDSRDRGIVGHLQKLIDAHGKGRTFTGRLDAEGEESADFWRLTVRDGKAVRIDPAITWPDETDQPTP